MKNSPHNIEQLEQWDRTVVWHPFTQMSEYEPLIIEHAQGCTLTDIHGRTYLDAVSSMWCNVHGHRHPKLDAALKQQIDRVSHVTALGSSNIPAIELAQRLVELSPKGLNHVFFSDSGATAIEVALKIAFQYWRQCADPKPEKTVCLTLEESYHGDTIGSVSLSGVDRFNAVFRPLLFEVIRAPMPDLYRLPVGVTEAGATKYYLDEVEKILAEHHHRISAMVVEPIVQGAAGMVVQPEGFLSGLRALTKKYEVFLIADEVAVGFGKTGTMFACEQEDVSPDFLCLAKGLTGGYLPVAATLTTSEVYNAFLGEYRESKSFFHGHTYGGNPLGAAVALANLDVFEEEQTLKTLPVKFARLQEHLHRIAKLRHVGDVRQKGLIAGIELVEDRETKRPYPWDAKRGLKVCEYAREHGVIARPLGNVIVIMPPLSVTLEELDTICTVIEAGIRKVTETTNS